MKRVFVDTNIIIDYTKKFDQVLKILLSSQENKKLQLFVNPIVIGEFFTDKNLEKKNNLELAFKLFDFFEVVNLTKQTGVLAGKIMRTNQAVFLADAFIAASCLQYNLLLATKNKKDFQKIKGIRFYSLQTNLIT